MSFMSVENQEFLFLVLGIAIVIFEILMFIGILFILRRTYAYLKKNSHRKIFRPTEYLPEEEVHTLKQVTYLILITLAFINIIYALIFWSEDLVYFAIFDIGVSMVFALDMDTRGIFNKLVLFLLIPLGSMGYLAFGGEYPFYLFVIHVPVFFYFIKKYYDKFVQYTESNRLGVSILLLFSIVFVSFIFTSFTENVNLLDSLVMVSNAFTSNGYSILGHSELGKINAIVLVWGGYILSGVGTASLTAAILTRNFNHKFDELKELIEKNNED